ncbi:anti-sigma factor antagonist [Streptomyces sp. NPDC020802]|uniref:anti-sigma factor antagonist n=1 Tax=Streptomyces sp. NPDC020802 TaxID=3365094 RepID=UPI0037B5A92F
MSEPVLSAQLGGWYAAPCAEPSGTARGHPAASLQIETHAAGERMTLTATGEVDIDTYPCLQHALRTALGESVRGVDLDLTGVDFCDCTGLNVLLHVRRRALADGKTVVVRSASPAVERLLTLTDTSSLFAPAPVAGSDKELRDQDPRPGATHSTTEESPLSDDAIDAVDAVETVDAEQDLRVEVVQLKRAMQTRPVIDLARGVLMASFGLSPEDAWSVLVTVSQNANIKLHHLAEAAVATVQGEPLPDSLRQQLSAAVAERVASRSTAADAADTGAA